MHVFLALIIFGLMGAVAAYGFMISQKAVMTRPGNPVRDSRPMAGVTDEHSSNNDRPGVGVV